MKKLRNVLPFILFVLGVALVIVGLVVMNELTKNVSGLLIGVGAGLMGMNAATLFIRFYYRRHPEIKRQLEIDAKDERSLFIAYKAKAKAFDIVIGLLIAIPFLMILADLALWLILSTVAFYLLALCIRMYYSVRYNKEM